MNARAWWIGVSGVAAIGWGQGPVKELTRPTAVSSEPFTAIAGVRELADGRVIVADMTDKVVSLVGLAAGTTTRIGREGRGPGEYSMPAALVAMPGDRTFVYDVMNQRFLELGPGGRPARTVTFSSLNKAMVMMLSPGADSRGRLYFQGMSADIAALNADSVPILRSDLTAPKLDTVGFYRPKKLGLSTNGKQVKFDLTVFVPEEAWVVSPSGRIARVIPEPYHVVWYDGAKPTAGPTVPYRPLPVTEADRAEARKMLERTLAAGRAAAASARRQGVKFSLPEPEFAPTKPPFLGQASALAAPNDEVWVQRTRPAGDETGRYDRFDRAGKLIGEVRLGPRSRVVGFGKRVVYVARSDEDDLQHLERYRWP